MKKINELEKEYEEFSKKCGYRKEGACVLVSTPKDPVKLRCEPLICPLWNEGEGEEWNDS